MRYVFSGLGILFFAGAAFIGGAIGAVYGVSQYVGAHSGGSIPNTPLGHRGPARGNVGRPSAD